MTIVDIEGNTIEVTDLDRAIDMADYFKDAHHVPMVRMDKVRQAYWKDIYEKLMALKQMSAPSIK